MKSKKSNRIVSRILLLEEDRLDARASLAELSRAGFELDSEIVSTPVEFAERLRTRQYDLILADYRLPDWTALDALTWLRGSGYKTPFILVTDALGEDLAVECIKSGASDYVLKQKLDRLPHACRRAMEEATLREERDLAQKQLTDSEEQYKLLFDASPSPMWVFDRETLAFLAVNEAAVRHYGFSREEFLATNIRDIRAEEDIPALLAAISRSGEGLSQTEVRRHRKKNRSAIYMEITSHTIPFLGRPAALVLAQDITELYENLEKLRQSEEKFAKAFRSSPLAVTISTRAEGRYLEVNSTFLEMVEYDREELIGQTALDLKLWLEPEERVGMLQQLAEISRVTAFETKFVTRLGEVRIVEVSAELIELDGIECVLAIIHDVTEGKRLEEQFRQAQKMEAVGRLAGGIAHDFNNMLSVIIGYSELLQEQSGAGNSLKAADEIMKAAKRAAALTGQLLAFSRRQVLCPRILDLNVIVENLSHMLRHMIGEDIHLMLAPGKGLGRVKADPVQVEQVIMNLVVNARDAMPHGGRIVITTSNAHLDEACTKQHPSIRPGSFILLTVNDHGSGMSEVTMRHIFEPFFTTKDPGKGTGLGLSMVYGVISQSNGCVLVSSELGKGTTFKIYLPRVDEYALIDDRIVKPSTVTGTETILLVEDEEPLRILTADLLERNGYKVLQASDGAQAITISKESGQIDLLITDVVMPGINGKELASSLRQCLPAFKLLFISGYTSDAIGERGVIETEVTLLEKPFTKNDLLSKVRIALNGL